MKNNNDTYYSIVTIQYYVFDDVNNKVIINLCYNFIKYDNSHRSPTTGRL